MIERLRKNLKDFGWDYEDRQITVLQKQISTFNLETLTDELMKLKNKPTINQIVQKAKKLKKTKHLKTEYCGKCDEGWIRIFDYSGAIKFSHRNMDELQHIEEIPKSNILCDCSPLIEKNRNIMTLSKYIENLEKMYWDDFYHYELSYIQLWHFVKNDKKINITFDNFSLFNYFGLPSKPEMEIIEKELQHFSRLFNKTD